MSTRHNMIKNILSISALAILLCACKDEPEIKPEQQPDTALQPETQPDTVLQPEIQPDTILHSETPSSSNEAPVPPPMTDWQKAYLAYLDELEEYADSYTYALIYVDGDDIPELVTDTGYSAGGCRILTFHDGIVDALDTMRLNFTYIERGNLLCNSDGHMDSYYDYVSTIQDGKWESVATGEYGAGPEGIQLDENGNIIYLYQWNGADVDEAEYSAQLEAVFPREQACTPSEKSHYYTASEMRSLLQTGAVTSAEHHYELIVQDITWEEARSSCLKKGGYLATITSWEELGQIEKQIVAEGRTDISFWVGANDGRDADASLGFHWTRLKLSA